MTKIKISRMQFFLLIPNLLYAKAIGITAGVTAREVGGDAWTAMSIGFFAGILVILGIICLNSKFPEQTIIQISQEVLGKWPSKLVGAILLLFFAAAFATSANVMTMHLKEYFLIDTPFWIICLAYVLLCMYGAFLGIENIIRFSLWGFLGCLVINITMIFGTWGEFEIRNLLPLFDQGLQANIRHSIYIFGDMAMAIFAVGMIYPMLNNKEKVMPLTFWAMIVSALMILIWPIFELGVIGSGAMKQYVVVCMQQVRCAQLTRYLPRYELIMVGLFTFSTFVQSATLYYCSLYSVKQISGLKKDRHIILTLALILFMATYFMAKDHNSYVHFLRFPWAQICISLSLGLPLLIFIAALIRGKLKSGID
ncbi:MAG: GerAB/ArcD/ProY family transporter [Syntrophomonadaceae bacterium]|nr:GerAB/ArcD/ProY family transporter [Syntrophomonadaceae bacterium]